MHAWIHPFSIFRYCECGSNITTTCGLTCPDGFQYNDDSCECEEIVTTSTTLTTAISCLPDCDFRLVPSNATCTMSVLYSASISSNFQPFQLLYNLYT